jgi:hypothetical protein
MRCAICGRETRELNNDLCFRCYVISRAIRLEPEMPSSSNLINIKPSDVHPKHSGFALKPFVTDLHFNKSD